MSQTPEIPDSKKIHRTLKNAHRSCQEIELAGLQLEEVITRIEQENRKRRKQQLERNLTS